MKRERAFTLIELLVAVVVIAILIAILLPSLARARVQARVTVCATNLKGLGFSLVSYGEENNGFLPGMSGNTVAVAPNMSTSDLHSIFDAGTKKASSITGRPVSNRFLGYLYGSGYINSGKMYYCTDGATALAPLADIARQQNPTWAYADLSTTDPVTNTCDLNACYSTSPSAPPYSFSSGYYRSGYVANIQLSGKNPTTGANANAWILKYKKLQDHSINEIFAADSFDCAWFMSHRDAKGWNLMRADSSVVFVRSAPLWDLWSQGNGMTMPAQGLIPPTYYADVPRGGFIRDNPSTDPSGYNEYQDRITRLQNLQ